MEAVVEVIIMEEEVVGVAAVTTEDVAAIEEVMAAAAEGADSSLPVALEEVAEGMEVMVEGGRRSSRKKVRK